MESVVHKKKDASDKVKKKFVRDALPKRLRGYSGWQIPSGSIAVFTETEGIEVKHYIHKASKYFEMFDARDLRCI